jgi:hypothetical protein
MMKKAREFNDILDECLERIITRGETVEQCLAVYPEYAAELEPLLRTSLTARDALDIRPRPEFRERARHQFRAALQEAQERKERRPLFFGLQLRWATAVTVVLVLILASGGTVAAAGDSMPDDALYPVKVTTENVRLALTFSDLGKAEMYARLADKRVNEIVNMAGEGKVGAVEQAAERMNSHLIAMAALTAASGEQPQEEEVAMMLAPTSEPAPSQETEQQKEEPDVMAPAPPRTAQKGQGPPERIINGKGAGSAGEVKLGQLAELRMNLASSAIENPETLRQALETAPEAVKPALQRAIDAAERGYQKALGSLD